MTRIIIPILFGLLALTGCKTTPEPFNVYACSPQCFVECYHEDETFPEEWGVSEARDIALYCETARKGCVRCIEQMETEGRTCGLDVVCRP